MAFKRPRNAKDLLIQAETDILLDKLERSYARKTKRLKNKFVDDSAQRYQQLTLPFNELDQDTFIIETTAQTAKQADRAIKVFSLQTYKVLDQEPREKLTDFLRAQYMQEFGLRNSQLAADTAFSDIKRTILKGQADGLSSEQIARNIRKLKQINKWRAVTIARTETGFAQHFAQKGTIQQIQSIEPERIYKKWLTAKDGRVRHTPPSRYDHTVMEGVTIPEDLLFDVQGDRIYGPRDPNGAAGNVINCRCVMTLYRESELNL